MVDSAASKYQHLLNASGQADIKKLIIERENIEIILMICINLVPKDYQYSSAHPYLICFLQKKPWIWYIDDPIKLIVCSITSKTNGLLPI